MHRATPVRSSPAIADRIWQIVPGPLRKLMRSQSGRRLVRFAPAAVLALGATQLTFFVCQLLNVSAGKAGAAGWLAGAAVSYVVSRWAWERKGRPHLLKETLPFVVISVCVGLALTGASKLGSYEARALGLHGIEKVVFAQAFYLGANCVTFVIRFLIFHYVLFADRGSAAGASGRGRPSRSGPAAAGSGADFPEAAVPTTGPLAMARSVTEPGSRRSSRARRLRSRSQVPSTTRMKLKA
jgi:putative flippase GtrA